MIITAITENTVYRPNFTAEHGLCLLLEVDNKKILIDTGKSNVFLDNLTAAGVSVKDIDFCIITHGHYDHTGGLPFLIECRPEIPIYISPYAKRQKKKLGRDIGMTQANLSSANFIETSAQITQITEHVYILAKTDVYFPEDSAKAQFKVIENNVEVADDFIDEQTIILHHGDSISIISGCSHNGPTNIIETARKEFNLPVKAFIGGLHMKGEKNQSRLNRITNYLNSDKVEKIVTCHCTGIEAYAELKQHTKIELAYLSTGHNINLSKKNIQQ